MRTALAVMALAGLFATPSGAFELLRVDGNPCGAGRNLFWPSRAAAVSTGLLSPEFQGLADEARARWNDSAPSFRFRGGSGAACDPSNGIVTMTFAATDCNGASFGDAVAVTRSRWNATTGELLDADVVFNARAALFSNRAVFLEVAMHELGHVLGLDHSDACGEPAPDTLMKSTLGIRRIDRPQADDIAGATFIYPPRGDGRVPEGGNSCALADPAANRARGVGVLLGAGVLAALGRWCGGRRRGPANRRPA